MSAPDQQTTINLIKLLLSHKSSGKLIGTFVGLVVIITACSTLVTWNLVIVRYLDDVNYAKRIAPIIARAEVETRDSLNMKEGYFFIPLNIEK